MNDNYLVVARRVGLVSQQRIVDDPSLFDRLLRVVQYLQHHILLLVSVDGRAKHVQFDLMRPLLLIEHGAKQSELSVLFLDEGGFNLPKRYITLVSLLPRLHERIIEVEEHLDEVAGLLCQLNLLSSLLFITQALRVNVIEDGTRFRHTANAFQVVVFLVQCNNLCLDVRFAH